MHGSLEPVSSRFRLPKAHLEQMMKEFKNRVKLAKYCPTILGLDGDVTYRMSKWIQKIQVNILELLRM